ncbi:carboxymuconolactone decarboxylase family protein [Corynebacterium pelargi]|uniref:Alkyl hydroperoxide reductase AhpD n=1 Tax=Corynebacterium pelargi TaxID=1471400 RepID=A0A410W8F2_9CORY|nr:carboxymuconolactone decarboxylase family protein [Corynebacterium pelargi]QAU52226.1 Alkyl hydroperoxide reductase AhpD [Corynebacterium pelargi]GGG69235.1 alkyl hydroperoxide reductase AhpD [Corynebacterium pelargi]
MSLDNLKSGLPEFAKDLKLNLGTLSRSTELSEQQLWGTFLATAAATRNEAVFSEIAEEAKEHLSEEAVNAALGAASIMAMNNVAYRAKGWLGDDYAQVKMGLRMNIIAKPGVEKVDFELWSLAVSSINGCEHCTIAHEKTVRNEGLTKEQIFEAVKIAATVQGVAQAVEIEAAR